MLRPFRPKIWQNKFEVDIFKNVAKIANLRPKIGQIPLLSLEIIGHNSIIGVQIKAISLLVKILVFGPIFAPRHHMGKIVRMDPKPA